MMKILTDLVLKLLTGFRLARWTPIPLRLIIGYGFMQHGFAKLSRGPDSFATILQAMGVPDARPHGDIDDSYRTPRRLCCARRGIHHNC